MINQEDKELLLKDLCARLPYGVIVEIISYGQETSRPWFGELSCKDLDCFMHDIAYKSIRSYLRPMDSMTEEEAEEYRNIDNRAYSCPMVYAHIPASERIDWLNAHHFDYCGLIKKELAIEALEGMYK